MFNDIINIVISQQLHESCVGETPVMTEVFFKFITLESIQNSITYAAETETLKNFPIMFIEYNENDDEFILRVKRYNKINGMVVELEEKNTTVKWVPTFKNQYVLTYSFGSKMGETFKNKLPVIIKNK